MLIGQSVIVPEDPGTTYHGPWTPRQGNAGTAVLEIIRESSSGWTMNFRVQTKNAEDSDASATPIGGLGPITTTGTHLGPFSDCLELVRVVYEVEGGQGEHWLHLRSNPIQWQPN